MPWIPRRWRFVATCTPSFVFLGGVRRLGLSPCNNLHAVYILRSARVWPDARACESEVAGRRHQTDRRLCVDQLCCMRWSPQGTSGHVPALCSIGIPCTPTQPEFAKRHRSSGGRANVRPPPTIWSTYMCQTRYCCTLSYLGWLASAVLSAVLSARTRRAAQISCRYRNGLWTPLGRIVQAHQTATCRLSSYYFVIFCGRSATASHGATCKPVRRRGVRLSGT